MISKYDDFILEQALTMINESEIVYSQKFRKLLKEIESPVAKSLVDIETKDLKVPSNYFDIDDNKDTISFIADRKAQEILGETKGKYVLYKSGPILTHNIEQNGRIFDLLGYIPKGDTGYKPEDEGERGEIIKKAISPSSGKTYLYVKFEDGECVINEQNITYDENTEVWSKNRQSVRTGRGIRALLAASGSSFKDAEIEDFVNKYKSAYDRMNDIFRSFELVSGDDIGHFYNSKNYLHGTNRGTLGNSCMATVPVSFFQIYTKNPEVCSLLILRSDDNPDKIKGRALVWKLSDPEIIFMDRIYTQDDSDVQLFKDYAKSKKWFSKKRNDSSPEGTVMSPEGKEIYHDELSVKINNSIVYTKFPYVDTLKNFDSDNGILSTDDIRGSKCLESTSGGYEGSNNDCDRCGGDGEIDCPECNSRGRVKCEDCDGDGEFDCGDCDGEGKVECGDCDGEGKVECLKCDGEGKDKNGLKCKDCKGKGKIDCEDCEGKGKIDCDRCDSKGKIECEECDGEGKHNCEECRGDGVVDCPDCS